MVKSHSSFGLVHDSGGKTLHRQSRGYHNSGRKLCADLACRENAASVSAGRGRLPSRPPGILAASSRLLGHGNPPSCERDLLKAHGQSAAGAAQIRRHAQEPGESSGAGASSESAHGSAADLHIRIGELLREARHSAGRSQAACGVSAKTLSRIEHGRLNTPDAASLHRIADEVGCEKAPEFDELGRINLAKDCTIDEYSEFSRSVAAQLQAARLAAGLDADTVAAACGLSSSALEMAERGILCPVSASTMRQIAQAVGRADIPELAMLDAMDKRLWPDSRDPAAD